MVGVLLLASLLTLSIGVIHGDANKGLIMKTVTPEKVEGEYHGQMDAFSSPVK